MPFTHCSTKTKTTAGTALGMVAAGGYGAGMTMFLAGTTSSPLIIPAAVGCAIVGGAIGGSWAYGSTSPDTPGKMKLRTTAKYALGGAIIGTYHCNIGIVPGAKKCYS